MNIGQKIIWLYQHRGIRGYYSRIPGTVVRVSAKRIAIQVATFKGEPVIRHVKIERLQTA